MGDGDWIKLHRKTLESRVWSDPTTFYVWGWCLMKANWKPGWFHGVEIPAGGFVFGRHAAAEEINLHPQVIYRAMKRLESWGQLTMKTQKVYNRFTVVSICNWSTYQGSDTSTCTIGEQSTYNQRTIHEQSVNTIEEGKERKKEKNIDRVRFVAPSPQEVADYGQSIGYAIDGEAFCDYYSTAGWKLANGNPLRDWKAAVRNWRRREEAKKPKPFKQRLPTDEELAAWTGK
jgi:hypothetical protein